ncbi:MFS transporter [Angustibacter peucedani]
MPTSTRTPRYDTAHPRYKWVVLSNTTLGVLLATVNASIVLISLPAIFRGIALDPLEPANVSYLLWMLMGYLLVTAVLVVSLGRLGDQHGRVRTYNAGFAVFALSSVALALVPFSGGAGALWLIGFRVVQGVGGAMLMANSTAILTDAFPAHQRGMALGINQVAALAGSFVGLVLGGLLAEWHWRSVFWVSVPIGLVGTVWAYRSLHELGERGGGRVDWVGNLTFGAGLTSLLAAITYGIQPYGDHDTGWANPWVVAGLVAGVVLLVVFWLVERRVEHPMFHLELFRDRTFALGNAATLLASVARGGLQFMLIIWLQGVWLPLHGYDYEQTPLWAGIYLVPLTIGFLAAGPVSGHLSDRYGSRLFAAVGLGVATLSFVGLLLLPVNFSYGWFAALIALNGVGSGLFAAPNTSAIMGAVEPGDRGSASGMRATFMNAGMLLSIGIFFSLMIAGLAQRLPGTLDRSLVAQGVPAATAQQVADLPPVGSLFAAFLGYNPVRQMLGPDVLAHLPADHARTLVGTTYFPDLISGPLHHGLVVVFLAAAAMCLVGALVSLVRPTPRAARPEPTPVTEPAVTG